MLLIINSLHLKEDKEYIEYKVNDECLMNIEYEKFNDMIQKNLISDEELDSFCNKKNKIAYFFFLAIFLIISIILAYFIYKTYIDYKIEMSNSV